VPHQDLERASQLAAALQSAILAIEPAHRPSSFESFPRFSCGDASLLLHSLLKDADIAGSRIAEASRGIVADNTETSHAWVELGDIVLDITTGQFKDGGGPIYVGPASSFHRSFTIDNHQTAAIDAKAYDDAPFMQQLRTFYVGVRSAILGT
jgi:hypothetical protein